MNLPFVFCPIELAMGLYIVAFLHCTVACQVLRLPSTFVSLPPIALSIPSKLDSRTKSLLHSCTFVCRFVFCEC